MSLADVETALQKVVGSKLNIRVDQEAFAGANEVKLDRLYFEPGNTKVADFLFRDLSQNRIGYYFDPQGIVLAPRSKVWKLADVVEYSPEDFGMTADELRIRIFSLGDLGEWADDTLMVNRPFGKIINKWECVFCYCC